MSGSVVNGTVMVFGHPAQLVCGGPDDSHFDVSTTSEQLTLSPVVTVMVITTTGGSISLTPVPADDLPKFLNADTLSHIFEITGNTASVTALTERYDP